ncbi:hypothetical protein [Methylocystis sp.]|jgi:membrane associated rhomboid family serine protease|uniref:hypothetical protein n=1 Tax=Methylocystis sp. TaxID=1911079 RepID=UPI0027371F67|nr:hypothetical protein [Methylocystis sp.]MDP3554739.1 hypothetical protein [Methylocystis sp.]
MAKTQKMAKTDAKTYVDAKTSDDISGATAPLAFAGIGSALAAGLGVAAAGLSVAFMCAIAGAIGGAVLGVWVNRR